MYITVDDVRSKIRDESKDYLVDQSIEDPAERETRFVQMIEEAIEDACSEIDGYLNSRYSVPLASVPSVITKLAKDIAVYNLYSQIGIDEDGRESILITRYKDATAYFKGVAQGKFDIGLEKQSTGTASAKAGEYRVSASPRLFSRSSMKGM